jgi:hypothetical protein
VIVPRCQFKFLDCRWPLFCAPAVGGRIPNGVPLCSAVSCVCVCVAAVHNRTRNGGIACGGVLCPVQPEQLNRSSQLLLRAAMAAKPAKSYERPGLSEEEIEEIREAFNLFDTDGSGAQQWARLQFYVTLGDARSEQYILALCDQSHPHSRARRHD